MPPLWLRLAPLLILSACTDPDRDLPASYRSIAVPSERLSRSATRQRGRELYLRHCALCHGQRADGRGLRQRSLSSPPADFTDPAWRAQTSPRKVYHVIREGVPGTPMASWKSLTEEQCWDLTAFLLSVMEEGP